MELGIGIWGLDGVLDPATCEAWVAHTEAAGFEPAPVTTAYGFRMIPEVRNNERVIVDDVDAAAALWPALRDGLPDVWRGRRAVGLNERLRFYRYDVGQRFDWHRDGAFARDDGERSLLTVLVYLNDGFEGGETLFRGLVVRPVAGSALVFDHEHRHCGAEVRAGRKYVLRTDVMFAPRDA